MEAIVVAFVIVATLVESPLFVGVVTALLGGGAVAAWTSFRKVGPEVEAISVKTMREVTDELRLELSRLSRENEHLRESNRALRESVDELRATVDADAGR